MKPLIKLTNLIDLNPVPWQKFYAWCGYENGIFEYELNERYGAVSEWSVFDVVTSIYCEIEFTDEQTYLEFLIEWS